MTRIEHYEDEHDPRRTGWYINEYMLLHGMLKVIPYESVGPYESQAEAMQMFHETGGIKEQLLGDDNA